MKNFFKKFKSYGFWVSLSAGIILLVNALGRAFGFSIENQVIEDCIMSFAGVLVILGIVTMNEGKDKYDSQDEDETENTLNQNENDQNQEEDVGNEDEK